MKQLEKMKKPEDSCMQAETRDEKEAAENLKKKLYYVRLLNREDTKKLYKLREQNGSVKYQFIHLD